MKSAEVRSQESEVGAQRVAPVQKSEFGTVRDRGERKPDRQSTIHTSSQQCQKNQISNFSICVVLLPSPCF